MTTAIVLALVIGAVVGVTKLKAKAAADAATTREVGRLQHRRSGEFPSSCSWCKNTALARKLTIFERSAAHWKASDVMTLLLSCPDRDVDDVADRLVQDQSRWRRFCGE